MSGFGSGSGSGSDFASANMSFHLPTPLIINEEAPTATEKQGIVSILGCNGERAKVSSLRRTLSADMSSKKWLEQNGFSPIKKVASSEHLAISAVDSSSSDSEDDKECIKRPSEANDWISILSHKTMDDNSKLPPPYIHPLVKKASSLSEKSLEVCTESLGSETGSDVFSSYSSSESDDGDEEKDEQIISVVNYNYGTSKKVQPRSFPPPLPSLSRVDGPSLHMQSRRENGRLVLEAVSVPSNNFFRAQRQDGRLLLTLLDTETQDEAKVDEDEGEFGEYEDVFGVYDENESEIEEDEDEDEDEDEELEVEMCEIEKVGREIEGNEMEMGSRIVSSRVISVHRSALSIKKLMGFENLNPSWSQKFNKGVKLVELDQEEEMEQQEPTQFPSTLRATGANSFNAYEYFWRAKSTANHVKPLATENPPTKTNNKLISPNNHPKVHEQQEMVLLRANKALVPSLKGCKEPRRSLLLWEPCCIATS